MAVEWATIPVVWVVCEDCRLSPDAGVVYVSMEAALAAAKLEDWTVSESGGSRCDPCQKAHWCETSDGHRWSEWKAKDLRRTGQEVQLSRHCTACGKWVERRLHISDDEVSERVKP